MTRLTSMGTVKIRLMCWLSTLWTKAVSMVTSHLMKGRYISHFDLNSLKFTLSFGGIFSYIATSYFWPDILNC